MVLLAVVHVPVIPLAGLCHQTELLARSCKYFCLGRDEYHLPWLGNTLWNMKLGNAVCRALRLGNISGLAVWPTLSGRARGYVPHICMDLGLPLRINWA